MTELLRVSPPEDGLASAMAVARGRRYRKAGLSTGVAAAALSCLALVAGSGGRQTLIQEPRPELPAVTGVDAVRQTDATLPDGDRTAHTVGAAASRPNTGGPSSVLRPGPAVVPLQDSTYTKPLLPKPETPYRAGEVRRSESGLQLGCVDASQQAGQLCSTATVAEHAKGVWRLQVQVCSTRTYDTELHFPERNEVDLVVSQQGEERWRWSRWHPRVEEPHVVPVYTGGCTYWTYDWRGEGFDGKKLPKGEYYLKAKVLADELSSRPVALARFTIG